MKKEILRKLSIIILRGMLYIAKLFIVKSDDYFLFFKFKREMAKPF